MSMEEILKGLREDYLKSLPGKISDIQSYIQSGQTDVLETAFHKLKGTGKTYGIPEISELAAAVEHICHDRPERAPKAAATAILILEDIRSARVDNREFHLKRDARFNRLVAS